MRDTVLGRDTGVMTVAQGIVNISPTVARWGQGGGEFDVSAATHVAVSGSLPPEVAGVFELSSNDGRAVQFLIENKTLQSGRPVGCMVEFIRRTPCC
jgi:hypothetical protein